MAADVHPYVNDIRETAPTEDSAWEAASRIAKTTSYYGLHDAARKRREPSQAPGAWAGALIITGEDGVFKLVLQERWDKVKGHIATLKLWSDQAEANRKDLEQIRGLLVYVSLTYTTMTPYLKGIHLSLESWRIDRDEERWRMAPKEWAMISQNRLGLESWVTTDSSNAPNFVKLVPRYEDDIQALQALTSSAEPPQIRVCPTKFSAGSHNFWRHIWLRIRDLILGAELLFCYGGARAMDENLWRHVL
ncbi:hypothetical protein ACA910_004273 [Epithemia clementina (nom. ined.)]